MTTSRNHCTPAASVTRAENISVARIRARAREIERAALAEVSRRSRVEKLALADQLLAMASLLENGCPTE